MIHGETRIVLRNPISGNILKDVTSENTFQTVPIQQYARGLGRVGARLAANEAETSYSNARGGWRYRNMLGGLFLFRDSIPVGNLYMPAGNVMTGNGSYGVANSDVPNELGSFNAQESSESPSAVTQVYDFATNQANGRIGCVCLTSQIGGYIGYGNASGGNIDSSKVKYFENNTDRAGLEAGQACWGNKLYTIGWEYNNPILTITKEYVPITQASYKDGMSDVLTFDLSQIGTYFNNFYYRNATQQGKYLYITGYVDYQLQPGGTGYYYKFDMETETLTQETFVNSTTVAFDMGSGFKPSHNGTAPIGFFHCATNPASTAILNLNTSVHLKTIPWETEGCDFISSGLVLIKSTLDRPMIYDAVNDTLYPINAGWTLSYGAGRYPVYDPSTNVLVHRGYSDGISIIPVPWYLATINNLNSPVTKTAAQTMKVTYTLTEA